MRLFIGLLSIFLSIPLWAQEPTALTVFKNQDALQKVLTNQNLINSLSSQRSDISATQISVVSSGRYFNKKFIVRLSQTVATPAGLKTCYNDINLESEILPPKELNSFSAMSNQLVIKKILPAVCGKKTSITASI